MGEAWLSALGWWIAAAVAVVACLNMLAANPVHKLKVWLQLIVYYAKYWALWLWCWALWHLWLAPQAFYAIAAILALLYLYISWIEPNRLQIRYHTIDLSQNNFVQNHSIAPTDNPKASVLKLAVIGDIHVGIFTPHAQLQQLVSCLNRLDVDAIVVTGDWLYHAGTDIMGKLSVLKALNKPCYSVLSEDDEAQLQQVCQAYQNSEGGNYLLINEKITQVLATMGITVLGQTHLAHQTDILLNDCHLLGFSDGAVNNTNVTYPKPSLHQKTLILTHDIKQFLANSQHSQYLNEHTLIIAGQTHGGQVNVPLLTPWLVNALTGNRSVDGLTCHQITVESPKIDQTANANVSKSVSKLKQLTFYSWTNTGIGLTGLPFRFRCPPRVDVLTII